MKRSQRSIATGILIFTLAVTLAGFASAGDATRGNAPVRAESGVPADAPLIGRIVVTPSPKQLAQARLERPLAGPDGGTAAGQRTNIANVEAKRAL